MSAKKYLMCFAHVSGIQQQSLIAVPFDGIATLVSTGINNQWKVLLKPEYQQETVTSIIICNEHYKEDEILDDFFIESLGA